MKKNKMYMIFITVFFLFIITGCDKPSQVSGLLFEDISFQDIIGVTEEEIIAIEELQRQGASFTLSAPYGTELFRKENGETGGYTALFCRWLSKLFGFSIQPEIVPLGLIAQMLYAGEAGFAIQVITEERLSQFYLSDPIAQRSVRIMRLHDSQPVSVISQTRLPRFVFLEGAMMVDLFAGTPEPGLIAEDYDDVYRMLQNGEADAFVGSHTMEVAFDPFGGVITEDFFPLTFIPIALATGNEDLEPVISVVTKALLSGAYSHLTELYRQGHREYIRHRFLMLLTEEERTYIQDNPIIPFATQYQSYPLSFYNRNEGRWEGAIFDVLDEMEQLTGMSFTLVNDPGTELPELLNLLEDGTAFMIPNLVQSDERRERFIWPSTMYITDRYALLSKRNFPNVELNDIPFARVGLHRGSAFTDMFRSWFPNAVNAVEYPSSAASFAALDRGDVDLVMSTQSRLATMTNLYELSDYKANFLFNAAFEGSFGLNKEQTILSSIIDKALLLINTDRIMEQWQSITYDYEARLMRAQRPWLFGIAVLALCVLALVSVLFTKSRSTGKKLEKLVRQRTSELESEIIQRKAAENEAMASSKAKTQFLANMSHEIRTPMNSIMGFAELASDSDSVSQMKDYMEKITDSIKWLLHIINDILDISKIESGKMELEQVPFDLRDVFSRCQSVILPSVKEKGLDLSIYAEPSIGKKLLGDPLRLYQVLMNLLSNAVKFTNAGTVKFSSAIKNTENGFTTVYFEIKDSGIGMDPAQVKKVFDPFIQADSSTTRDYGGTGLGLAIAKNIVEMMGGKLAVESSPGLGSTFSFEIVFETKDSPDETPEREYFDMPEKPYFDGLVLICDDNSMNQEVICAHLTRVGLQSMTADNGKMGVEMVEERIKENKKPFDIIFMDMFMPVMDGMEAAAKIMALNTGTPIVAMTANIMVSELEKYKKAGMPDCLGKPFTSQELWRILLHYLKPISNESLSSALDDQFVSNELQRKLQIYFVKNNQTVYAKIMDAVAAGDIKQAHRLAHSLKGNAGMIGKTALASAAADVEERLKSWDSSAWDSKINNLKTELELVLDELEPLLDQAAAQEARQGSLLPVLDAAQIHALFEKLEPMLKNINPECTALLDEIRAIPGAQDLAQQIENFDFESAASELAELKRKIEN
ncbi:MAG: ATP-binding protein [Treponema sp.]|nr:ATP-binding protein [Treponema sp.]